MFMENEDFCNFNLRFATIVIICTIIILKIPNSYMFRILLVHIQRVHRFLYKTDTKQYSDHLHMWKTAGLLFYIHLSV